MNNKKGFWQIATSTSGLILIFLVIFFFLVLPSQQKGIHYFISLEKDQIKQGNNVDLFFKIINKEDKTEMINKVRLEYKILDTNIYQIVNIGELKFDKNYYNNINLNLRSLNKGHYTIETTLIYEVNGKEERKSLSLGIDIF